MIIAIEYKNGRMKEFDTSAFTATNAMSAGDKTARNVMTELDLRLDLVNEVGLRLDFYWYDATPQGQRVDIPGLTDSKGDPVSLTSASRRLGTSVLLCSREGIKQISRIIVQRANGTVDALWRQGYGRLAHQRGEVRGSARAFLHGQQRHFDEFPSGVRLQVYEEG